MRLALVVAAALALAAPAFADQPAPPPGQALSPEVVPGAGLSGVAGIRAVRYRFVHALGVTPAGSFRVDFAAGPGNKIVLVRGGMPVFRALRLTSMRWAFRSVRISGIGLVSGNRVHFTALRSTVVRGTSSGSIGLTAHGSAACSRTAPSSFTEGLTPVTLVVNPFATTSRRRSSLPCRPSFSVSSS